MGQSSNQPAIPPQGLICPLEDLGLLAFRGPDARRFLQGQLSNDVLALAPGVLLRAGVHTPQGRTLALLALMLAADEEILAALPRELLEATAATLRRYVLRARVQISDASDVHRLYGVLAATAAPSGAAAAATTAASYAYEGTRRLLLQPAGQAAPSGAPLPHTQWRALDIAAGLPQLYRPTSGQFVAQMLNLDCIGAISFDKGCYTGQEVIARAHYRGHVKRRMQRFLSDQPADLAPGDDGRLADGRRFRVVNAFTHPDGRSEFLAVAPLPGAGAGVDPEPDPTADAAAAPAIAATALPLPYELPA